MDSVISVEGRLLDIVDKAWREDTLPHEDIEVPQDELPDFEADNGDSRLTVKEQENKWSDLALGTLCDQHQGGNCAQCAVPTCKQLNFLPTECDHCHLAFCGEHSFVDHHGCTKFESNQVQPEELPSAEKNYHKCSYEGCSSSSPIAMICPHCRIHFCLSHRYHGCMDSKEQQKDRRRKEYLKKKVTQENFKTAKEETDKQVEMKLQTAEKQPEKAAMVQKIRFMKIKSKSLGDNKIPGSDRVYFSVHPPLKSDVSKSTPLFGAKDYTIGKAIDIFASKLKVLNENHKKEAPKLRLFKHMTGSILTHDMKETIDSLLKKDIVYNGDTLILEYVNVEDLDNNTPTLKDLDSLSRYTGSTV